MAAGNIFIRFWSTKPPRERRRSICTANRFVSVRATRIEWKWYGSWKHLQGNGERRNTTFCGIIASTFAKKHAYFSGRNQFLHGSIVFPASGRRFGACNKPSRRAYYRISPSRRWIPPARRPHNCWRKKKLGSNRWCEEKNCGAKPKK